MTGATNSSQMPCHPPPVARDPMVVQAKLAAMLARDAARIVRANGERDGSAD